MDALAADGEATASAGAAHSATVGQASAPPWLVFSPTRGDRRPKAGELKMSETGDLDAADALRTQLLGDLDGDVLPMAHVETIINRRHLADTPEAHHALALGVIGALLHDQLILVGDVVGGDPAWIEPWPGTSAEVLKRIRSRYVDHYTDHVKWDLSIWFSLNDERRIWRHNNID